MAVVHEVHKLGHSPCNAHWAYKIYYLYYKEYIKSTGCPKTTKKLRLTNRLIAHNNQIAQPPSAGVERTQGYFTTKKSEPRSFGFLPQFSTRVGRFFIQLISYLLSDLSQVVL